MVEFAPGFLGLDIKFGERYKLADLLSIRLSYKSFPGFHFGLKVKENFRKEVYLERFTLFLYGKFKWGIFKRYNCYFSIKDSTQICERLIIEYQMK